MTPEEIEELERTATRWAELDGGRVVNLVAGGLAFITAMRARGFVYFATRESDFVDIGFVLAEDALVPSEA